MSSGFLTNESANQSTSWVIAKRASRMSFSVRAGNDTLVLGKFTPFFDLRGPPCTTIAITSSSRLVDTTSKISLPSSKRIRSPGFTSVGNSL